MTTTYPNLGFDPSPGSVDSVDDLQHKVEVAAQSMVKANDLMNQLRSSTSGVWQGPAGDAFRSTLNSTLIDDLGKANQSLNEAVTALKGWSGSLTDYKSRSDDLERQAAAANDRLKDAQAKAQHAADNPDFGLAGRTYDNQPDLQAAQNRLNAAADELQSANNAVTTADDELQAIRKQAQDLQHEWDAASSKVAEALQHASEFAPHKPGLLHRMGDGLKHAVDSVGGWVKNHLDDIHSVLSTISAVAGVIALFTPPPIDIVAGAVALVAGAGALATTLADPKVRGDIGAVLHGNFKGHLGGVMQLVGDGIALAPGVGFASKSLSAGAKVALKSADAAPGFIKSASTAAKAGGLASKNLIKLPIVKNAVLNLGKVTNPANVAEIASEAEKVVRPISAAKKVVSNMLHLGRDDDN